MSFRYKIQQLSIFHWLILILIAINVAIPFANHSGKNGSFMSHSLVFPPNIVSIILINSAEYIEFLTNLEDSPTIEAEICYELGPFTEKQELDSVKKYLVGREFTAQLKTNTQEEIIGHWVYLKPERSRALSRLKVEEIKLKGLTDVVLLTQNNPRNAISLGFFTDRTFANRRLLKAQSVGLDAKLDVRYKNQDYQWLVLNIVESEDLQQLEWLNILQDYENTELKTVNCE